MKEKTVSAVLVKPREIELREFPVPRTTEDDAFLLIEGTGICGSDWTPYSGASTQWPEVILGHEMVGRVAQLGEKAAKRWGVEEGDRVVVERAIPCGFCKYCLTGQFELCSLFGTNAGVLYGSRAVTEPPFLWGGFGHHMYLHPNSVVHKISPSVPIELAATHVPIRNGIAWVQETGGLRAGQTVVIQGPGQMGLGCVIAAKEAGAGTIIVTGTAKDTKRLEVARRLGADYAFKIEEADVVEQVRDITGGAMAHLVVDVTHGAPQAVAVALDVAAIGGTIVLAASYEGKTMKDFMSDKIVRKKLTIKGALGHGLESITRAVDIIESGKVDLDAMCTHTFPIAQADLALRTLGGEADPGAIHITVVPD